MKPYKPTPGSKPSKLMRVMEIGREYSTAELAELAGVDEKAIHRNFVCARLAGVVTSRILGINGKARALYTLVEQPDFNPTEVKYQRIVKWHGGKARPAAPWPVGPCMDFSNKYNVETFYGAA